MIRRPSGADHAPVPPPAYGAVDIHPANAPAPKEYRDSLAKRKEVVLTMFGIVLEGFTLITIGHGTHFEESAYDA